MARHPVVDDLYTRRLEHRDVERSTVRSCALRAEVDGGLVFDAVAERMRSPIWDPEAAVAAFAPATGAPGTLRVDVVADDVLRVRYAEAPEASLGDTPMIAGALTPPSSVRAEVSGEGAVLETPSARFEITLAPFRLRARDSRGRLVTEIGGAPKNHVNPWDAYNTGVCRTREGSPLAVECFALSSREAVYGFGERFTALDKVGQTVDMNMEEAMGTTTTRSYKNVPFFWSTGGWGVSLNHSCRATAWVGSRAATDVQIALEDDFLDYYLFVGGPKQILGRYVELTGKSPMPPLWSFGFWQSKISYQSANEALEVVRANREAGIPTDVLHLDTHWFRENWRCDLEFDPERFPEPAGFMQQLGELGVKVSLWQLPYIPEGSKLFEDLEAVDGFVKTEGGELYDIGICYTTGFEGRVGCIDFTNPDATRVYQSHLKRLFSLGARVIKADFGEQAPLDGVYHDGTPGHRAHNLYPLLYNQAVAEATHEANGEWIIWARSTWAGSQRYPLHWGGDSSANWHNLAPQIAGGLSLGLSAFPFWSMDIGGFFGEASGPLMVRWMQAGVFFSHPRIHGTGDRELWKRDDETLRICRDYLRLHYRLLPYLWATARECIEAGLPVSRAMVVEWPDDPSTWGIGDQWMLGDAILVAPILNEDGWRRVYLPEGTWTDWWTGHRTRGPRWIEVEAGLATLPLWLREGALVPMAPVMDFVGQRPIDELTLRVVPLRSDGTRTLSIPTPSGDIEVTYQALEGRHEIRLAPDLRVQVEVVGGNAPAIDIRT